MFVQIMPSASRTQTSQISRDLRVVEIGRDLDEHRSARTERTASQQRFEMLGPLQVAQAGRIRRGEIQHRRIRVRRDAAVALDVRLDRAFERDVAVLADVDEHGHRALPRAQPRRDGVRAVVVEAHAVDERSLARDSGRAAAADCPAAVSA